MSLEFIRNEMDPCVYQLITKQRKAILNVYVDDIVENEIMRRLIRMRILRIS